MDEVLKDTLTANLESAKTPEAKIEALTLAMIALCDCQYTTAQRVKALPWKIGCLAFGMGGGVGALISNFKALCAFFWGAA